MDASDYMRSGPRRPGPSVAQRWEQSKAVQLCATCKHGMETRADEQARPVFYCLLAGVEIVHVVETCSRFAEMVKA